LEGESDSLFLSLILDIVKTARILSEVYL